MSRILGAILAATIVAGTLSAPAPAPAHADDASYLAALDARGVFRSGTPDARLSAGHKFCNQLRNGATPNEIVATESPRLRTFGAPSMVDDLRVNMPQVIEIARQEICPETLGGPPPPP